MLPSFVSVLFWDIGYTRLGLIPTLKPSGFQFFSKAHNPLSFNVGPEGKKSLTTSLGLNKQPQHKYDEKGTYKCNNSTRFSKIGLFDNLG